MKKQKLKLTWIGKESRPKLEPKASNHMEDATVLAKKEAAIKWCKNASDYAAANRGKPWRLCADPAYRDCGEYDAGQLGGQFGCYQDLRS